MSDMGECSAVEAVARLRAGDMSAESYARELIARWRRQADLNIFISRDDDALIEAARDADRRRAAGRPLGPLHGLPLLLKDNIETAALPTTAGTPGLRGNHGRRDAAVAARLFAAGALLAGKANMHELAAGAPSDSDFGQVRNPHDRRMATGGSSSGCAAALAARLVAGAIGSDTGGSARIPAALCGVAGLRPSLGRYSTDGLVPISASRDTAGPMARTVADLALLDGVIAGTPTAVEPVSLKGMRFGLPRGQFFDDLDDALAAVIEAAVAALRGQGAEIVEADIPGLQELAMGLRDLLVAHEIGRDLPDYLRRQGLDPVAVAAAIRGPDIRRLIERRLAGDEMSAEAFGAEFARRRGQLQAAYDAYIEDHGLAAVVFPTTPLPARPIEQMAEVRLGGQWVPAFIYNRNTNPGAAAGLPGITVPAGLTADGLPVGLAFDGRPGDDRRLLAIAAAFEAAIPALPPPRL